ncbi:methyltransferase [Halovenus aranensis]|uniref:Methyltransferase n=1 Tax=Halovenus aranensis TaxID=890420 RepID=A0A1G8Y2J3_9EURY|nr:class I SAM-dependent methyltransferase family protein [Halovenus aranensis]SDJ96664.1 methyltransferase [Halovenus aranensis]
MSDQSLAAVVTKQRTQIALSSLRQEGVYDEGRHITEHDDGTVAIPVTDPPAQTDVLEVVRTTGETRLRTLEDHLRQRGWTDGELDAVPGSWAVIGSVILVDTSDTPRPAEVGDALLAMHGHADTVLSRDGIAGVHREPSVEVIAGEGDTHTVHREHGTTYALDLSEVMFSPGNKAERAHMGETVDDGERVLDMFAGVGYFTLPMARGGAHVTAIEHNPTAFQYLVENVVRNGVQDSVETYRADCRDVVARGVEAADPFSFERVVMGYYDAYEYLDSALSALESDGTVHMHEATPEAELPDRPVDRLHAAAERNGRRVSDCEVREIKGYSEGVTHVVVDATVR